MSALKDMEFLENVTHAFTCEVNKRFSRGKVQPLFEAQKRYGFLRTIHLSVKSIKISHGLPCDVSGSNVYQLMRRDSFCQVLGTREICSCTVCEKDGSSMPCKMEIENFLLPFHETNIFPSVFAALMETKCYV